VSSVFPQRTTLALDRLPTPSLILDRAKLGKNLARMSEHVAKRGVAFRPHLKTAKAEAVAHLAAPARDFPITVSTLREAEYFAYHGFRDIFYAIGLGPGKLARVVALLQADVRLVTMVDHPDAARAVRHAAERTGALFNTVIEIDCGEHRGGVPPGGEELLQIARILGACLAGVATHGGHSYAAYDRPAQERVAADEADAARMASRRLADAGFRSRIVSIGSSPTALAGADLSGITEMRAGVYMFWDVFQAAIGACTIDDIALTVLTEVIGRPAGRPSEFLIDAGAFALSKDISTAALGPEKDAGYGLVANANGDLIPGLMVKRVWQEQGLVVSDQPLPADAFRIGDRVRILPIHACPTAAAHDRYYVVSPGAPVEEWTRVNGW
jgi:D-serine deaminase-like pyridoxal phosphate-dependent protein